MTTRPTDNQTTTFDESGLTRNQRDVFHTLVNDDMDELTAYQTCLAME